METHAPSRPIVAQSNRTFWRFACVPFLLSAVIAAVSSLEGRRENGYGTTLLMFAIVGMSALGMIYRTAKTVGDANVLKICYVFLAKLLLVFVVFGGMWSTQLRMNTDVLKADQERYYDEAGQLARRGFDPHTIPNINYPGVLYVYGAVFALFGENAYAAALFNAFMILIVTILLIRVAYRIKPDRDSRDWTIGLVMLVPDVILCDVMTSRDALAMSLLSIAVLLVAAHVTRNDTARSLIPAALLLAPVLLALAVVRMTALIPAVASIIVLFLIFRSRVNLWAMAIVVVAAIGLLIVAPVLSARLGGYHMTYAKLISLTAINPDQKFIDGFTWTKRSIGRLLIARSAVQAVLLAVPRTIAYLIVPLPKIGVDWKAIARGEWGNWQRLLTAMSSLLYVALFPFALASLRNAAAKRDSSLALIAPFWITIFAVASGTAILHERYRVMAVPLMCGSIWLGRMASRRQLLQAYAVWAACLCIGTVAVALYKNSLL